MSESMDQIAQHVREVLRLVLPPALQRGNGNTDTNNGGATHKPAQEPLVIGLTGLQGSGKSTWAGIMVQILQQDYHLRAITVSLDDFYHTQKVLSELRLAKPVNKLHATRGQPGTHDAELARNFFQEVRSSPRDGPLQREIGIPVFDKSQHSGRGDRAERELWPTITEAIDVIVFEGWCVGFQAISGTDLQRAYQEAQQITAQRAKDSPSTSRPTTGTVADHDLDHVRKVNEALAQYNETFMGPAHFDTLVHLDTDDLSNVYAWRIGQEEALRKRTGSGMSDEEVIAFVRGYMPAYELYLEGLRRGFYAGSADQQQKAQVRIVLEKERQVQSIRAVPRPQ